MFWRKWFTTGMGLSVTLALSACSSSDSWLSNTSALQVGEKTHSEQYHHYYHQRHVRGADNAATSDYFATQTINANSDNNLWVAIRQDFQINHYPNNPEVQAQIAWFIHNQGYLYRTARRAAPFMYYIFQQVKARNLPSELVLLPIIESAYNPFVSNPSGATGLWEIMPGTAHSFGLREDWWYDGRRDITASTNAALDYFSYLQNFFGGNWLLAIAAYDTGEGNVEASIRHNTRLGLSTDYWALPLAAETRSYVPRLLALAAIVDDPQKYGIHLPPISNTPYLGEVEISSQITLVQAARMANMTLGELKTLNSGYRGSTLDPNQPYRLLLPLDRINLFRQNLLQLSGTQGTLWERYEVQPKDTWKKIAKRFNTSIRLLQEVNHLHGSHPPVGKILLIPENAQNEGAVASATAQSDLNSAASSALAAVSTTAATAPMSDDNNDNTMTNSNSSNDSSTTTQTTADNTNNSTDNSNVNDGNDSNNADDVTIEQPNLSEAATLDASAREAVTRHAERATAIAHTYSTHGLHLYKVIHKVKHGETLDSIARSHHVATVEIARWNHLSRHSHLRAGQKIIIWYKSTSGEGRETFSSSQENHRTNHHTKEYMSPRGEKHQSHHHYLAGAKTAKIIRHKVQSGETLDSIAHKYGVTAKELQRWNHLSSSHTLRTAQTLVIYRR